MHNVGESKAFAYQSVASNVAHVFKFWDGTVEVNSTGTAVKTLNMGGDPNDGFKLYYSGTVVDARGTTSGTRSSLVVNNPPVIVQAPSVTVNDAVFPYSTVLSLSAYDLEEPAANEAAVTTPLTFVWRRDGTEVQRRGPSPLVATGTSALTNGTYRGEWTGLMYRPYRDSYACNQVTSNGTVSVDVVDKDAGTTTLNFSLLGRVPSNPYGSPRVNSTSLIADATGTAHVRVGKGQKAVFTLHTAVLDGEPAVKWEFPPYFGWKTTSAGGLAPTLSSRPLPNGAWEFTAEKPLDNEEPVPGHAPLEHGVTVTLTFKEKAYYAVLNVILLPNRAPQSVAVTVFKANGDQVTVNSDTNTGSAAIPVGGLGALVFKVSGVDPDWDLVTFNGTVTVTPSSGSPYPQCFRGPVMVVPSVTTLAGTTALAAGSTFGGDVTGTDRFGQFKTVYLPTVTLT